MLKMLRMKQGFQICPLNHWTALDIGWKCLGRGIQHLIPTMIEAKMFLNPPLWDMTFLKDSQIFFLLRNKYPHINH